MSAAIRVSTRVLYSLRDAYWTLKLIEDEKLNATAKVNLREIRWWAISIANLVDEILSKAGESDGER